MNKLEEIREAEELLKEYEGCIDKVILDYLEKDKEFMLMLAEALEVDDGYVQP